MNTIKGTKPPLAPIVNDNLKNLTPKPLPGGKTPIINPPPETTKTKPPTPSAVSPETAESKALSVASDLAKIPLLPLKKAEGNIAKKLADVKEERTHYLKTPSVVFIDGFDLFGSEGMKDMATNFPHATHFNWADKDNIVKEINRHLPDRPVILVGHGLGGTTALEVSEELNSAKNGFKEVDLLVTLDAVGFNNNIIPLNVKKNLNFFKEGVLPFTHGGPNIARNTEYSEVINELKSDEKNNLENAHDVQFKIFEEIKKTLSFEENNKNNDNVAFVIELPFKDFIGNLETSGKKQ